MLTKSLITILYMLAIMPCMVFAKDEVPVQISPSMFGSVPVKTWKETRYDQVIRQQHEFSCGAAALATLLTYYYGIQISEEEVLKAVNKEGWLSLADIQQVLPRYGMKGIGLALNYDQLTKLKIPVILYIENPAGPHFAVLRGLTDHTVWVADPANGNIIFPLNKFLEKWEVRPEAEYQGKILAVIPVGDIPTTVNRQFFMNQVNQ